MSFKGKIGYEAGLRASGVGYCPLSVNRFSPFSTSMFFFFRDLSSATFEAEVRAYHGQEGEPQATLNVQFGGLAQVTIGDMIEQGLLSEAPQGYDLTDEVNKSKVVINATEDQIDLLSNYALDNAQPSGCNFRFFWDLKITESGIKRVELAGEFNIINGVTR